MLKYCVISHTHWDREWYEPFEVFRLRLVQLIDHCLATLKKYPDFVFHLDAQTVVLEDYLELRPSRRAELAGYIREKRLIVGPWYLQNDFYLTSGEATVRNLLVGMKLAEEFGACGQTGYMPDQFGLIPQIPQIMQEFGIQSVIFGRGYNDYAYSPDGGCTRRPRGTEFLWEAPDGSRVMAVHMKDWYNNAQRFSARIDRAERMVHNIRESFEGWAQTPYLLLMNGVDHLEAQDDLLPILEQLNACLPEGEHIEQTDMDTYLAQVRQYLDEHHIPLHIHRGAITGGHDEDILQGTHSSRIFLKQENVAAQDMLESKLEPLYTMLERFGASGAYEKETFDHMWKQLMKNHPHDSICCCGRDEIARHMADQYARLREMAGPLLRDGLRIAAEHTELAEKNRNGYLVQVANTTEFARGGLVQVTVDIPTSEGWTGIRLLDAQGQEVPCIVLSERVTPRDTRSPVNLPGTIEVVRRKVLFHTGPLEPFAFRSYQVVSGDRTVERQEPAQGSTLENSALRVTVSPTGQVDVLVKKTGKTFCNVLDVEDAGDRGDSYLYRETGEARILGSAFPAEVRMTEQNPFRQSLEIRRVLPLPVGYDFKNRRRTPELAQNEVVLTLSLEQNSRVLEISTRVDNRSENHRLRLMVRSGILSQVSYADTPYSVEQYDIEQFDPASCDHSRCATSFAMVKDGEDAMAVFHRGNYEYEHLADGTLAVTLVRGTSVITCDPDGSFHSGDGWLCPENQCIGVQRSTLGLLFDTGALESWQAASQAKSWRIPLLADAFACDPKKFTGGRFAVQDSLVAELFFLPDPFPGLQVPENTSCLKLAGDGLLVTALKKAEDTQGHILRFVNLRSNATEAQVCASGRLQPCTLAEGTCGAAMDYDWNSTVPAGKIISIRMQKEEA